MAAPATLAGAGGSAVVEAGDMVVAGAWMAEVPRGHDVAAAYFTLANRGSEADVLTGASSPMAQSAMLHANMLQGDVSQMRAVKSIAIGPGENFTLKPGGVHVMLMGLKQPLQAGAQVPLVLTFKRAGNVTVTLTVGLPGNLGKQNIRPYGPPR